MLFRRIMQHMFAKKVPIFNGRLMNNILFQINLIWFENQNIKFRLTSRNSLHFEIIISRETTKILFEK